MDLGKVHDKTSARVIFHVDLDAFFVAVERVLDPSLYGKPVVVGGSPEGRGVVAAASYEARAYGVRSAMPMSRALRLCPQLLRVRGSRDAYRRASRAVFSLLREATPCIQKVSIDEAYLDLSDQELVEGRGFDTAWRLQHEVKQRFRLDLSIGIASNRLVAKIASGASKPVGVFEVLPGQERAFLAPLPVRKLPGIGPATAERLHAMRIQTLGELVAAEPRLLEARLGRGVGSLQARASGIDTSPVRPPQPGSLPKSISHETTFPVDRSAADFLEQQLVKLLAATTARLRQLDARARTVSVKLRFEDYTTQTRDRTLLRTGHDDADFLPAARELLRTMHDGRRPIRLLGVKLAGLEVGTWQPDLFAGLAGENGPEAPNQAPSGFAKP
jgi:DNA polymerase-4